ncbi:hypothetical protein TELCIR_14134, partial [Teladorsagia circumcincta]
FCGEFNWSQEDHTKLVYGISLLVVQFVIPAIIMSFCYWKILQKILEQMYFKLLNVHAIAMTSVVWNPLLYFWMSKRHRRALKDDMTWLTNVRRHTNGTISPDGILNGTLHECSPTSVECNTEEENILLSPLLETLHCLEPGRFWHEQSSNAMCSNDLGRFKDTGSAGVRKHPGAARMSSRLVHRDIVRLASSGLHLTAADIHRQASTQEGPNLFVDTVHVVFEMLVFLDITQ